MHISYQRIGIGLCKISSFFRIKTKMGEIVNYIPDNTDRESRGIPNIQAFPPLEMDSLAKKLIT